MAGGKTKKDAVQKEKKEKKLPDGRCGECSHCVPVTRFHTLNVHGQPTLGECPYWTLSRCVLLSQRACKHFTRNAPSS